MALDGHAPLKTPLIAADPWASSDPLSKSSGKVAWTSMDADDQEHKHEFEEWTLLTRFVFSDARICGMSLERMLLSANLRFFLAGASYVEALAQKMMPEHPSLILCHNLSKQDQRKWKPTSTQLLLRKKGKDGMPLSPDTITAVQPAKQISVTDAPFIDATLRIREVDVASELFSASQRKDQLAMFLGTQERVVTINSRRLVEEGSVCLWQLSIPRQHLRSVLSQPVCQGCTIRIAKHEERAMQSSSIFVESSDVRLVCERIQSFSHLWCYWPYSTRATHCQKPP